jgi:hypothetical protein
VDVFATAQGDVMIAGPANTFYDLPAGDQDVWRACGYGRARRPQ